MMIIMISQSATVVKLELWKSTGELYPNVGGSTDFNGINGGGDTSKYVYPAPGKGIYNDGSDRYIQIDGEILKSEFTVSSWIKMQ